MERLVITIDHDGDFPYCYYGDDEGITSSNNPAFWYAMGWIKPNYPMPSIRYLPA